MRYLVFETEAEAWAAEGAISNRARELYATQGYAIDENGAVIGKNALTGELEPDAQRTVRYAIPHQRSDARWIIPHPEGQAAADFVLDAQGTTVQQHVMQDLGGVTIQDYSAEWFSSGWTP